MNKEKFPEKVSAATGTATSNPAYHVANVRNMMDDLVKHLQEDEGKINDPQALALFETSREVLKGLMTAFEHYQQKSEKSWKK